MSENPFEIPAEFIPRNKFDVERIAALERAGTDSAASVYRELLEWIQDINWPVARPLCAALAHAGPVIVPHLRAILESPDAVWKSVVLDHLAPNLAREVRQQLFPVLRRIAQNPTPDEITEGCDASAKELLARE